MSEQVQSVQRFMQAAHSQGLFAALRDPSTPSSTYRKRAEKPLSAQEEAEDWDLQNKQSTADTTWSSHGDSLTSHATVPHDGSMCGGDYQARLRHRTIHRQHSWEVCHETGWFTGLPPIMQHLPHGPHLHMPHVHVGMGGALQHLHVTQEDWNRHTPEAILNAKEGLRCEYEHVCMVYVLGPCLFFFFVCIHLQV
jgi:hypothetical protein